MLPVDPPPHNPRRHSQQHHSSSPQDRAMPSAISQHDETEEEDDSFSANPLAFTPGFFDSFDALNDVDDGTLGQFEAIKANLNKSNSQPPASHAPPHSVPGRSSPPLLGAAGSSNAFDVWYNGPPPASQFNFANPSPHTQQQHNWMQPSYPSTPTPFDPAQVINLGECDSLSVCIDSKSPSPDYLGVPLLTSMSPCVRVCFARSIHTCQNHSTTPPCCTFDRSAPGSRSFPDSQFQHERQIIRSAVMQGMQQSRTQSQGPLNISTESGSSRESGRPYSFATRHHGSRTKRQPPDPNQLQTAQQHGGVAPDMSLYNTRRMSLGAGPKPPRMTQRRSGMAPTIPPGRRYEQDQMMAGGTVRLVDPTTNQPLQFANVLQWPTDQSLNSSPSNGPERPRPVNRASSFATSSESSLAAWNSSVEDIHRFSQQATELQSSIGDAGEWWQWNAICGDPSITQQTFNGTFDPGLREATHYSPTVTAIADGFASLGRKDDRSETVDSSVSSGWVLLDEVFPAKGATVPQRYQGTTSAYRHPDTLGGVSELADPQQDDDHEHSVSIFHSVNLVQEVDSLQTESIPATEEIVNALLTLAEAIPKAIRNKHRLYRIFFCIRDICAELHRIPNRSIESTNWIGVLDDLTETLDSLARLVAPTCCNPTLYQTEAISQRRSGHHSNSPPRNDAF